MGHMALFWKMPYPSAQLIQTLIKLRVLGLKPPGISVERNVHVEARLMAHLIDIKPIIGMTTQRFGHVGRYMELAEKRCVITQLLQMLGEKQFVIRQVVVELVYPMPGKVFASEHARATRRAERVVYVALLEQHTALSQSVEIGRRDHLTSVTSQGVVPLLISHNDKNIGP